MKTILKILSLVLIIGVSSCDRPIEPTDYLDNRTPFVGFQGPPDVVFLEQEGDHTYEIFVGISAPIDEPVSYIISNDENSAAVEGTDFVLDGSFTIGSGDLFDSFIVNFDYDELNAGATQLFLNLSADGDIQLGGNNQFDLTIVKI